MIICASIKRFLALVGGWTIDFEPLISFVSQYKWGILLVVIGIALLIRIDLLASLIAVAKSKIGKKEKKEHHMEGDVIDIEYKVIEDEGEIINRK